MMINNLTKISTLVLCLLHTNARAETVRLPVTQDNSIVMVDGEWSANAGGSGRMRIKGNQHIVAMSFDASALRGRAIKSAELVAYPAAESIAGVSISTIATPWNENKSSGLTAGIEGVNGWGYAGARFPAVAGGNAYTLVHQADSDMRDGLYHWSVPADMVSALATGVAYGLAIHEHDADYGRNPSIYSREQSGKQPYLIVELEDRAQATSQAEPPPPPPSNLRVTGMERGHVELVLTAPASGFAYEIAIDGTPLARHNIPLVSPNSQQTIPLRDLPPSIAKPGKHSLEVVTLDRAGRRSKKVSISAELFIQTELTLPKIGPPAKSAAALPGLSVIPVTDKYDQRGQAIGELPADYRMHNALYDGQRIQLTAAAGEVVSFQALVRGTGDAEVKCSLSMPDMRIDMFQAIYVPVGDRHVPDPLLPLPAKIRLSNDTDQAIVVDIYVPFDAQPGKRAGKLTISDGRTIPIQLNILDVQLPKQAAFACEMNGYGMPDHVDDFYALQQVAYDHRVHANILHYSHNTAAPGSRKSQLDMRLRSGKRMDNKRYDAIEPGAKQAYWDDFVEAFGPYLDGSCFREGHRGVIPAPGFYLTFHESWPLNCRSFFNGQPDAYRAFSDTPLYAQTYRDILTDFARLAKEQGWSQTGFQVYFNNKGALKSKDKAPWILDEPSSYWDYRALQYYGGLTDAGRQPIPNTNINYRIDISRPEYCRGQLSGRSDLWVVSASAFQNYRRLVTDRMRQDGLKVWVYGTSNPVDESNRQIQAWALDSWQYGAVGLVPWQTIDKTGKALKQADQLGLFIFDKDSSGKTVIRHSMRLKAYRDAEQLIALLQLVKQRQRLTDSQMQEFIQHYLPLAGSVRKRDEDDAGTSQYQTSPSGLNELRQAALLSLQ